MGGLPFSGGLGQVEFVCTSYSSYSIDGVEYPSLGHSGFQFTNPFAPRTPEKKNVVGMGSDPPGRSALKEERPFASWGWRGPCTRKRECDIVSGGV